MKQQNERVEPISDFRDDVPPALDRAIRAALERDIGARYSNALEMAQGLEAGLAGQDTDITAGLDEYDATGYLEDTSDATQALPRGDTAYVPPARRIFPTTDVHPPAQRRQAEDYRPVEQRPARKKRNWGAWIAAVLALALAAVAIYLALGLGSDSEKIQRGTVSDQSDALIQYIRDHEANN